MASVPDDKAQDGGRAEEILEALHAKDAAQLQAALRGVLEDLKFLGEGMIIHNMCFLEYTCDDGLFLFFLNVVFTLPDTHGEGSAEALSQPGLFPAMAEVLSKSLAWEASTEPYVLSPIYIFLFPGPYVKQ
jgi:hypothetical protein